MKPQSASKITELDATYHDLVTRLAHIQARKADLDAEEAQIKAKLGENLTHGTYSVNGTPALTVSLGRRFDPVLAAEVLHPELAALCKVEVIDSTRAKAVLPPAVYRQCQRDNDKPTIRMR
jgi:hypothetical protein